MAHKCFERADKKLKETNTKLVRSLLNDNHIFVETEKIRNLRDGKRATSVIATYCPFCGKKLKGT